MNQYGVLMTAINVGDSETPQLTVTPSGPSTAASLMVTAPDGTTSTPAVTSNVDKSVWTAVQVTYTAAGVWRLTWTVTGTGAGVEQQTVAVAPLTPAAGARVYATSTDLAEWLQDTPPTDSDRLLRQASAEIERLTKTAVYDVDDDDLPTDTDVIRAFREAVCELVSWWIETGDESGAMATATSASIGSMSIGRGGGSTQTSPKAARVGPQVYTILSNAGLLSQPPATW